MKVKPQSQKRHVTQQEFSSKDIVYGTHPVQEVFVANKRSVKQLFIHQNSSDSEVLQWQQLAHKSGILIQKTAGENLTKLAGPMHQGVVARVAPFIETNLTSWLGQQKTVTKILALDQVTDPQNFGALARSALCFGFTTILLTNDRSVPITSAVCKASAGAIEHLTVLREVNLVQALNKLKEHGFWIYGAGLKATMLNSVDFAKKSVLVLGSEGLGLRPLVAKSCDVLVSIPMQATLDSLNVSVAGSVLMYEMNRGE